MPASALQPATRLATIVRERPRPERIRRSPRAPWLAVATVCLGAFMGQLDASIVTLTFPAIGQAFHTSLAAVEWVSLGYLVTLLALLVPAGRISDVAGRKACYLLGFAVFTAASAACAFAPTLTLLVGARIAQAVGAALMQANSVALITAGATGHDGEPGTHRSRTGARLRTALGVQAAAQAAGLALGPTVGGLLVHTAGWRWVFLINLPVGVVGLLAGRYLLPRTRHRGTLGRFDLAGLAALGLTTTAALLAVSGGSGLGMPGVAVGGLAALAGVGALLFWWRERRAPDPLVPLWIPRDRAVGGGLVSAALGYLLLFGPLVLGPVVLHRQGVPSDRIGLYLTALPGGFAAAAAIGGRLVPSRWGNRLRGTLGLAVAAGGMLGLAASHATPPAVCVALAVTGIGLGLFTPANNATVMSAAPPHETGTVGGLLNMTRALGTAVGVAVVTLLLHLDPAGGTASSGERFSSCLLGIVGLVAGIVTLITGGRAPGPARPGASSSEFGEARSDGRGQDGTRAG